MAGQVPTSRISSFTYLDKLLDSRQLTRALLDEAVQVIDSKGESLGGLWILQNPDCFRRSPIDARDFMLSHIPCFVFARTVMVYPDLLKHLPEEEWRPYVRRAEMLHGVFQPSRKFGGKRNTQPLPTQKAASTKPLNAVTAHPKSRTTATADALDAPLLQEKSAVRGGLILTAENFDELVRKTAGARGPEGQIGIILMDKETFLAQPLASRQILCEAFFPEQDFCAPAARLIVYTLLEHEAANQRIMYRRLEGAIGRISMPYFGPALYQQPNIPDVIERMFVQRAREVGYTVGNAVYRNGYLVVETDNKLYIPKNILVTHHDLLLVDNFGKIDTRKLDSSGKQLINTNAVLLRKAASNS